MLDGEFKHKAAAEARLTLFSVRGKLGEKTTKVSDELMETKVLHQSVEKCTSMTKPLIQFNQESMICAYAKGTDACQVRSDF